MTARRSFHYNIRRHARRPSRLGPLILLVMIVSVAALAMGPRRTWPTVPATSELRYESWHPPKAATRKPTEEDLAQLQQWLDETDEQLYAGTFPDIKIQWAGDMNDAYAFTRGDEIKFVRSKFYPGWAGNRDVVLHEMAHLATGHDHNILWDQERARLAEGRRVMTFDQVRKASR